MQDLNAKIALLIAYHFPPIQGSSGLQRTLGFTRHLPSFGWQPVVLAPHSRAYPNVDNSQLALIPEDVEIVRAFCLDAERHLSIMGRYPGFLAIPDRWISWLPAAVITGLMMIRKKRPAVIWSTYPIATSHIIARILSRLTGIPWVADFRDPMVERDPRTGEHYPPDRRIRASRLRVEMSCVDQASALVFCTEWSKNICTDRYPALDPSKCHVITNGFDESSFADAEHLTNEPRNIDRDQPFRLLHSGTIYPTPDRDPTPFFDALAELKKDGAISGKTLRVTLRATGHDEQIQQLLDERKLGDIVELAEPLPYKDALAEMMQVDGLLLFQGYPSNPAIPAKLYEYLRAGTPIMALVDASGSTAKLLQQLGTGTQITIEDAAQIKRGLLEFQSEARSGNYPKLSAQEIASYSRSALTRQLAGTFDALVQ